MNEEQKRFKVLKKEEYEEELREENSRTIEYAYIAGIGAIFTILNEQIFTDVETTLRLIALFGIFVGVGVTYYGSKRLIPHISQRNILKNKIEDINNELEMQNIETNTYDEQQEPALKRVLK